MGLFSSKTKISVFSGTYPLMESNPKALTDATLLAILSGNSIANEVLNTALSGMSFKIDRMRTYAKNHYTLGLSTGHHTETKIFSDTAIADVITEDLSAPHGVIVDFNFVGPMTAHMAIMPFLLSVRGWDPNNSTVLFAPPNVTFPRIANAVLFYQVHIEDIEMESGNASVQITYRRRAYYRYPIFTEFAEFADDLFTESYTIPVGLTFGQDYCYAVYRLLDSGGVASETVNWWYYALASQKYPELSFDEILNEPDNSLPVVPIRRENLDMTREAVQTTELYQTSQRLLDFVNIDINAVAEIINTNPDVAEIDHAYIQFGIDLQTENNEAIRYLVEFFDYLADVASVSMLQNTRYRILNGGTPQNIYTFDASTTDPLPATGSYAWDRAVGDTQAVLNMVNNTLSTPTEEYGLKTNVVFSYIRSRTRSGVVSEGAKIGTATKEIIRGVDISEMGFNPLDRGRDAFDARNNRVAYSGRDVEIVEEEETTGEAAARATYEAGQVPRNTGAFASWDNSTLILKLQITENTYKHIEVSGLSHRNEIYGPVGTIVTTLSNVYDDPDEHSFIIPIHYNVSKKLPILSRNTMYEEAFMLVLNSYVLTKVKWYQKGIFKLIVTVVALVLAVKFGQPYFLKLAAVASAGAVAVMTLVLKGIIISLTISQGLKFLAEKIGPEAMAILAVVVVAISIYTGNLGKIAVYQGPGMGAAVAYMPTASVFLNLSSSMMTASQQEITRQIGEIRSESLAFQTEADEKMEELAKIAAELQFDNNLAVDLLQTQTSRYHHHPLSSKPSEFYDLAIHVGNIGTLTLEVIPNFHDIMLKLPEADESLSRIGYAAV